jgi:hypothetical protein
MYTYTCILAHLRSTHTCADMHTRTRALKWMCVQGIHTCHACTWTHTDACAYMYTWCAHDYTQACVRAWYAYMCTCAWLLPKGQYQQGHFLLFSLFSSASVKNHSKPQESLSLWSQMDGRSKSGAPGNDFHTAGVCNFKESWSRAFFSCWPLVGVHSSQWLQFAGTKIYSAWCPGRCNLPHRRDSFCAQENVLPPLLHL